MKRILILSTLIVIAVVGCAALWFDRLFEEPQASDVSSLAVHLEARSVLAVFAHPDDEIIVAGSLADAADRESARVHLVTATRGETGQADEGFCRQEDLGLIRHAELLKHGYALGVDAQEDWSYPDGGIPENAEALTLDLVRSVRGVRPDVVITFDPASGYSWHPDHRSIGEVTTNALRLAADPSFGADLGSVHEVKWLVYLLAPRKMMDRFGGARGEQVAAHQVAPDIAVPVDLGIKTRGWRIHESQAGYLRRSWGVPPWLLYYFYDKEHYAVNPGVPETGPRQNPVDGGSS